MTDPQIDLSIIIASYNTCDLLQRCLESIYQFTRGISFEVVCIDDNSMDGSAAMVADLFPQVTLVCNCSRLLYARNHNIGTKLARGRYACHLVSDTLLTSNAMAALVRFMDAHPAVATCGSKLLNADGTVQHCIRSFAGAGTFLLQALNWHKLFPNSTLMNRYYNTDFDYSRAQPVQSIGTSAYVVRRSVWESVGMFDERFGQFMVDLAYNFTLSRRGFSVWYTPCAEVVHYGSRSIGQNPEASLRDETDAFIMFNECYGYFPQDWLSRTVVRAALKARLFARLFEQRLRADKSMIKGPAAAYQKKPAAALGISPHEFPASSRPAYEVQADLLQ
jgi:GT2 family glycosyltransferase